jgi:hypothetical protein
MSLATLRLALEALETPEDVELVTKAIAAVKRDIPLVIAAKDRRLENRKEKNYD